MRPPRSHESLRGSFCSDHRQKLPLEQLADSSLVGIVIGTVTIVQTYETSGAFHGHSHIIGSIFHGCPSLSSAAISRKIISSPSAHKVVLFALIHNDRCCQRNVSPVWQSLCRSHRKPQRRYYLAHKVLSRKVATPFPFS